MQWSPGFCRKVRVRGLSLSATSGGGGLRIEASWDIKDPRPVEDHRNLSSIFLIDKSAGQMTAMGASGLPP